MNIIKDYREPYMKYTDDEFCIFYSSTYEVLKEKIYRMWIFPAFMLLAIIAEKFFFFILVYRISDFCKVLLLIVGVLCSILIVMDKWYGALGFAILCLAYLIGGLGVYIDKIFWTFGAICSMRAMLYLLELNNLNTYFKMKKAVMKNKLEDEEYE